MSLNYKSVGYIEISSQMKFTWHKTKRT